MSDSNDALANDYADNYADETDNRIFDQSSETNAVPGPGSVASVDASGDNMNLDGEGATAVTGDANQVQSGDGIQAAGSISGDVMAGDDNVTGGYNTVGDDNTDAFGDAITPAGGGEGVNTGSIADSVIGDGNASVDAGGDASGPVSFGDGDAVDASTDISSGGDIGAIGDGNIQAEGTEGNLNIGGSQAVDEINADGVGGDANFGDGQIGSNTSFDVDSEGDALVAGGDQSSAFDNSATSTNVDASTSDSFNSAFEDNSTFDSHDQSFDAVDSFNTSSTDMSTSDSWNEDFNSTDSFNDEFNSADSFTEATETSEIDESVSSVEDIDVSGGI